MRFVTSPAILDDVFAALRVIVAVPFAQRPSSILPLSAKSAVHAGHTDWNSKLGSRPALPVRSSSRRCWGENSREPLPPGGGGGERCFDSSDGPEGYSTVRADYFFYLSENRCLSLCLQFHLTCSYFRVAASHVVRSPGLAFLPRWQALDDRPPPASPGLCPPPPPPPLPVLLRNREYRG